MVMRIESSLRLENDSEPHSEGWWKWSVWVEGSAEDFSAIESVTYRLHPTFPNPVVRVSDASTKFRLSSVGWGEFAISADAQMSDGRTVRLERWVELGGPKAASSNKTRRPSVFVSYSIADSEVVRVLRDSLVNQGIDVQTADETVEGEGGEEFLPQIDRQLQNADAVVALVSDPPSRFVEQEALSAHSKGRYVLPVVLGGATVHGKLSELARFELPDASNVESLARQIAARVKDYAIPDETTPEIRAFPQTKY